MIVLISCCEGYINTAKCDSMEDAKNLMQDEYITMLKEYGCDPEEDNTCFGIFETSAYFNYYDGRCDWQIEEL